jgi:nicotinamidase-related amidase
MTEIYDPSFDGGFEDHCWKDVVDWTTMQIFAKYRRALKIGARPALLAIDLYDMAYRGGPRPVIEVIKDHPSSCGEYAHAAIAPTQRLIAAARATGLPVIYSTQDIGENSQPANAFATVMAFGDLTEEHFRIRPEFAPDKGDLVIKKQRASIFYGTPLVAHLVKMGIDSVIICGESTSGCVRASAVDAYSNGFHTVLAEECCFDRSLISHKVTLFDLHHKYADVMHLDDLLSKLANLGKKEMTR